MKTEIREVYKCDYCNKLYQKKHFAENHEKVCVLNPDNKRACDDCVHLTKKDNTVYYDQYDWSDGSRLLSLLYCPKIDSFLYPPKVEHKKNFFDLGDELNQPMPRECKYQTLLFDKIIKL